MSKLVSCIHIHAMKPYKPVLVRATPVPSALPRQTLVSTAVDALRQRIIGGEFQEGESLNQVTIAREYDISRIPLREAMRQLEAEGLLVFRPGKGAVVSGLSLQEINEVIDLRAKIEPDLLTKAIPLLTSEDFEQANSILDEYEAALQTNAIATWGEFNWRFHFTLYAPSGCTITMGILQNLHRLNERYARVQISVTRWEQRAKQEHRALVAICQKRDKRKATALLKAHILTAGQALIGVIEQQRNADRDLTKTK
jgi:DNA-binding GntR family transcriptional regulator